MFCAFLSNRSLIKISGEDVVAFLQGLITNDANILLKNKEIYSALLSPQGKFLHDFFLVPYNGEIYIDICANRVQDLFNRLKIYKLRSKIEFSLETEAIVATIWGGKVDSLQSNDYKIYQDPRLDKLNYRAIGTKKSIADFCGKHNLTIVNEMEYEKFRLSLGVPDTADMIIDKSLLLECGFEELSGVDFNKGCYIGQEVTARSKFRGQVRKSFYKICADSTLPMIGTEIMLGDKIIGQVRTSIGNNGLAIINNDDYETANIKNEKLLCGGMTINSFVPEWTKISDKN